MCNRNLTITSNAADRSTVSSMVVRRLEDACSEDLRAPGFPEYLVDKEPEAEGAEVKPRQA